MINLLKNFGVLLVLVVILGLGVGGAYAAGYAQGQAKVPAASPTAQASFELPAQSRGMGAFAGRGTFGTVDKVEGRTITVTSQGAQGSGTTVKVLVTDSTQFQKSVAGSLEEIKPGVHVTVVGPAAADGTITAESISIAAQSRQ